MTPWATRWLLDTALAAGIILLLGSVIVALVKQPAKRQRAGEWTLLACLIVAVVQGLSLPRVQLGLVEQGSGMAAVQRDMRGVEAFTDDQLTGGGTGEGARAEMAAASAGVATPVKGAERSMVARAGAWAAGNWALLLVGAYAVGMAVALARLVTGHVKLWKIAKQTLPAEGTLAAMWETMISGVERGAELKVSHHVNRPICFGVWRPTVLLPQRLAESGRWEEVKIILLHELVHVRRRDAVTWLLASLAKVVFFYQPLLWHLQKQLRMAQEFIADAWAAEHASSPAAYAEKLVRLLKEDIRPMPAHATAAVRGPSEFYQRMQRLLCERGETKKTCGTRWTVVGGIVVLGAAMLCCGITVQAARTIAAVSSPTPTVAETKSSALDRGVQYLISRQEKSGGWLSEFGPAPTAMVIRALLQQGMTADSQEISRGLAFLETFHQSDNGYYADAEPTYNTAIVLSTLAMVPGEKYTKALEDGKAFLEARRKAEASRKVGGWYAAAPAAATPRATWLDPRERSAEMVLETYGSLTYAGLKSMVYAGLTKDDARVKRSADWLKGNWTLEKNPGVGTAEGLFYYYHLMARTLRARGETTLVDARGNAHDWRGELSNQLERVQRADGSWINAGSGRWLEDKPELVTAYAVLALQETLHE